MIICYMNIKFNGPEFEERYKCVIISNANRLLKEFANMKGLFKIGNRIFVGLSIHGLYICHCTMASKLLRQKTKLNKKSLRAVG